MSELNIYKEIALSQVQRILGLGDRSPESATYGCFDRYYWHYALKDFPNARFQEAVLLISLLYNNDFEGNKFYKQSKLSDWTIASIEFWKKIQNKNGSFNEYYPHEHSFIATAFTCYAVSQSLRLFNNKELTEKTLDSLKKSGKWLIKNNNFDVGNQMAVSAAALHNIYLLTKDTDFLKGSRNKITSLIKMQHNDGYFVEYGGYDIGYLSIAISFLAKYYKDSHDEMALKPLEKAVDFIQKNIDDHGRYDWRLTSRKTQYVYPHGLKIMESNLINHLANGLKNNLILNPGWMDDVFCVPLTNDYLQTFIEGDRR